MIELPLSKIAQFEYWAGSEKKFQRELAPTLVTLFDENYSEYKEFLFFSNIQYSLNFRYITYRSVGTPGRKWGIRNIVQGIIQITGTEEQEMFAKLIFPG